ncbi:hypothetical protein AX16_006418 [Volvariella volvacea WC 439]|nr:hypothetical protein AX16_006418 [Volvariella volvacea WC 439]
MSTPSRPGHKTRPSPSKRHTLSGPRPLHLLDGNTVPSSPSTAPLIPTSNSPTSANSSLNSPEHTTSIKSPLPANGLAPRAPKRQSSISYRTSYSNTPTTSEFNGVRSSGSPLLERRSSLESGRVEGRRGSRGSWNKRNDRRRSMVASIGPPAQGEGHEQLDEVSHPERPPLTLMEKHADLLHFIAQKESKCLELRSQLATHEAELQQLKRKWQRIVNRGLERQASDATPSPPNGSGGAVLDGIKEGVQGVSRLLSSGLNMTEPSSTSPNNSVAAAVPRPPRVAHSATGSNSSVSTTRSGSTRFSQSSFSSVGEEDGVSPKVIAEADGAQVLMVQDTGATPAMSPNPDFIIQQVQRQKKVAEASESAIAPNETHAQEIGTTKIHRRKSREVKPIDLLGFSDFEPFSNTVATTNTATSNPPAAGASSSFQFQRHNSHKDLFALLDSTHAASDHNHASNGVADVLSAPEESAMEKASRSSARSSASQYQQKRSSLGMNGFAPVSSIPGLTSLTNATTSVGSVSSWVGTVGKKWEELQKGSSFTKNQKRASLLLSDVSQSIVSVLSPVTLTPSPAPSTQSMSTTSLRRTSSRPTNVPASNNMLSAPALSSRSASSSSISLLDDDDSELNTSMLSSSVLTPDPKPLSPIPSPSSTKSVSPNGNGVGKKSLLEDDDEWNW